MAVDIDIPSPTGPTSELPSRCLLLELPAELRNYIFELVLVAEEPLWLEFWPRQAANGAATFQPSLSAANRQSRGECLPVFYARNTFHLFDPEDYWPRCKQWIHAIGKHINSVQHIELEFCDGHSVWLRLDIKHGKDVRYALECVAEEIDEE